MTAISVSGYGLGYNSTHPFNQFCKSLVDDGLDLSQYSLPNADMPKLRECIDFMKNLLASRPSEIYLHSLAVNIFILSINELSIEERNSIKNNLKLIFCITPGIGRDVARNFFGQLEDFYKPERLAYSNWEAVFDLLETKPVIVNSADDPYLSLEDVFQLKTYQNKDNSSPFIWVNLPIGNGHFNQHSDKTTIESSIGNLVKLRYKLSETFVSY